MQEHQGLGDLQQYLGCLRHTRSVALQKKICYEKIFVQVSKIRKYNNLGRRAIFSYEDNIYESQIKYNSETGWLCCIKLCGPSYQFPQNYATQLRSVSSETADAGGGHCCCSASSGFIIAKFHGASGTRGNSWRHFSDRLNIFSVAIQI